MNVFLLFYLIGCGLVLVWSLTDKRIGETKDYIIYQHTNRYGYFPSLHKMVIIHFCITIGDIVFSWLTLFVVVHNWLKSYFNSKNQKNSD